MTNPYIQDDEDDPQRFRYTLPGERDARDALMDEMEQGSAEPTPSGGVRDQALAQTASAYDASRQDQRSQDERITAQDSPAGSTRYDGTSGRIDVRPGINVGEVESQLRDRGQGMYHASDLEGVLRNTGYQTGGVSLEEAMRNAFLNYDQRETNVPGAAPAPQRASSGASAAPAATAPVTSTPTPSTTPPAGGATPPNDMRSLLMELIGQARQPVSEGDPGIAPILLANRNALQRGSERERQQLAEELSADDQSFAGAFNPRMDRINQQRAESEAGFTGEILHGELQNRRQQLSQLMSMAVASGDAAEARALQRELTLLDQQMTQQRFTASLAQNESQFGRNLSAGRYQFDNDLAYRLLMAELMGDQNSINAFG